MSLAAARLASVVNRTAVTAPLTISAFSKTIPGMASSSGPAAMQLKSQAYEAGTGDAYGDQHNHEENRDFLVHAFSREHPPHAEYFARARGQKWSTGVKKGVDGSLLSRTMFQPPTIPFAATRHLSTSADTTNIPSFSKEMHPAGGHNETTRVFTYLIVGSAGVLTTVAAKASVLDFLSNMAPSRDQVAMAKIEVDLNKVPEGKNLVVKWRGKPIFIRHRSADEIEEANNVDISKLRDKETDAERVKDPAYLVMIGVCTHLGCIPIGEAGEYGGWFCPCHGSHYDISGRIRKGPAPLNLAVPPYEITPNMTCVIG